MNYSVGDLIYLRFTGLVSVVLRVSTAFGGAYVCVESLIISPGPKHGQTVYSNILNTAPFNPLEGLHLLFPSIRP